MATSCRDDNDFSNGFNSDLTDLSQDYCLPPFPDGKTLSRFFPAGQNLTKADFLIWVEFTLANPDEIWEVEDTFYIKSYQYLSYMAADNGFPVFVVTIGGEEDFTDVIDYTIVMDLTGMTNILSGTLLYSRRNEWAKERLVRILNDKALEKYDQGMLSEAVELIDSAISISDEPKAYLHNNRGLILWKSGKIDEAKKEFLKSISLDGENGDPYFNIGLIYFDEYDLDNALTFLGRAVALNPSDSQFLAELGHVCLELNREKDAITLFEEAMNNNPGDAKIDFRLGHFYLYKRKAPRIAIRHFNKGLEKNPSDQFALVDMAIAHWVLGHKRKVKDLHLRIQGMRALMPYTISRLVYLNLELEEYEEALSYYKRAFDLGEQFEPEWLHFHAALVYAKTGRAQQALESLDLAVKAGGVFILEKARAEKALKDLIKNLCVKGLPKKSIEGKGR